jgi:pimeloyl-ACP methyl ester carboxylesterase
MREDDLLRGDVWLPADGRSARAGAIVVCHCFKGFKDWGFFPYLCRHLASGTGSVTVGFNFTGAGVGEDLESFTELEKFARNTFSKELEDLEAVLDGLVRGQLGGMEVPAARCLGLVGHSRGAAAAVLASDRRPSVRALVTWSAIAAVTRYESVFASQFDSGGVAYVLNARTGQRLPLRRDVLEDIRANRERLDVEAAAGRLRCPFLIVHGSEDESVPLSEGMALAAAAPGAAQLEVIDGAGHTMNASHPFPGPNPELELAVELTVRHFRTHLLEAD